MEPTTTNAAFTGWRSYILVEIPTLLFFFGQSVTGAVTPDLMLYRSCQTLFGVDYKDCDLLHTNSSSEKVDQLNAKIQPYVSYVLLWKSIVDGLLPALLPVFLGPWSDSYGRKPLLLAGCAGSAASFLLWSILSSQNLNPWLYIIASVPPALVGGYLCVLLASYCYIADIRKDSELVWHLTWLQAVIAVGQLTGNFVSPFIFNKFGYVAVFGAAFAANMLATLYTLFIVPESVNRINTQRSWWSLFDLSLVKKMIITCTKKREGYDRTIIWCCAWSLSIFMLVAQGELSIGYLFASAKLGWGVDDYSLYMVVAVLLMGIVGSLLGAEIIKKFVDPTMSDMLIAVLAAASAFSGAMTKAFANKSWHMHLSTALAMLSGLSAPVIRNALSNSAPPQDVGKVFSLTTSIEALIPLASVPLYTMVYSHHMPPIYPSPVYFVSAGFYAFIIVIVVIIDRRITKKRRRESMIVVNQEID